VSIKCILQKGVGGSIPICMYVLHSLDTFQVAGFKVLSSCHPSWCFCHGRV